MKRKTYFLLVLLLWAVLPMPRVLAEEQIERPPVIITEIQTGAGTAGDEFIELYNTSDDDQDITGWQLRYMNASSAGGSTTLIAAIASPDAQPVVMAPRSYFVVRSASVVVESAVPGMTYAAKLSASAKTVALYALETERCRLTVTDAVAWGDATRGEGLPVHIEGSKDRLLQRKFVEGVYLDTDNNRYDFAATDVIKQPVLPSIGYGATPGADNPLVAATSMPETGSSPSVLPHLSLVDCELPEEESPIVEEPVVPPAETEPPSQIIPTPDASEDSKGPVMPARNKGLVAPHITELLPNPAKPQTDAADEFVELYNSNATPFELTGFMLEAGKKRFTFPAGTLLEGKSFKAFFSAETRLALSNTQGQVRLLDPFGRVVTQTDAYQSAKDGQAWAYAQGVWQWSTTPTPNAPNVIKTPPSKKKATAAASSAKNNTTAKANGAVQSAATTQPASATDVAEKTGIHTGVLALVGLFALLYGAYEYRHDVANKLYQLRANRAARRENRQGAKGW